MKVKAGVWKKLKSIAIGKSLATLTKKEKKDGGNCQNWKCKKAYHYRTHRC